ncbi:MAG: LysE family translocator [Legionellales bacterium]|nr:LysE family translocator [Legionellales bacterium]
MDYNKLISIISINVLGLIIPGPSMVLLLKNSITNSKKYGLATAIGLILGDMIHILLIIFGLTSIILTEFISLKIFKTLSSIYLIYLGYTTIKAQHTTVCISSNEFHQHVIKRNFIEGLVTSVTNPSVLIFFSSMFIIIMEDNITIYELLCWSLLIISMTVIWLFLVVAISSSVILKNNIKKIIQKIIGILLLLSGINVYYLTSI